MGKLAYRLALLASATIHSVFHVSQLKKMIGDQEALSYLPEGYRDYGSIGSAGTSVEVEETSRKAGSFGEMEGFTGG